MKKPKWQRKLNKRDLDHIRATTDGGLLREFKRNRHSHLKDLAMGYDEPCYECRTIAIKLGLEK